MTSSADREAGWVQQGKVRARRLTGGGCEIWIDGLTTQARYYKPLVYEFCRRHFSLRPRWGDFEVTIEMHHLGEAPQMDLDNLCKALLDALKGFVFFDDSQIARLVAERMSAERDCIHIIASPRASVRADDDPRA
jgi:hypothetical protein